MIISSRIAKPLKKLTILNNDKTLKTFWRLTRDSNEKAVFAANPLTFGTKCTSLLKSGDTSQSYLIATLS